MATQTVIEKESRNVAIETAAAANRWRRQFATFSPAAWRKMMCKIPVSHRTKETMTNLSLSVGGLVTARDVWEDVFGPVERKALGDDLESAFASNGTVGMWIKIQGGTKTEAVLEIAYALGWIGDSKRRQLRRAIGISEVDVDVDELLNEAIESGGLVLNCQALEAFWRQLEIPIDFRTRRALWNYLEPIAKAAKRRRPIDTFSFGDLTARQMRDRKSKLITHKDFPKDLGSPLKNCHQPLPYAQPHEAATRRMGDGAGEAEERAAG